MKKPDTFHTCKKKDILRESGAVSGHGKSQAGGKLAEKSWRESKETLGTRSYLTSSKYLCGYRFDRKILCIKFCPTGGRKRLAVILE